MGAKPTFRLPSNMTLPDHMEEANNRRRPLQQDSAPNPRKTPKKPVEDSDRSADEGRESDSDIDKHGLVIEDSSR